MTAPHSPLFTLEPGQSGRGIYTSGRDAAIINDHLEALLARRLAICTIDYTWAYSLISLGTSDKMSSREFATRSQLSLIRLFIYMILQIYLEPSASKGAPLQKCRYYGN
jgi:hypothetical protein